MQLTRYTDYGFRLLIYLALLPDGQRASIDEIAGIYGVSRNNVNKLVHHLGKEGIIKTVRGKHGGVFLNRAPSEINIGEMVMLLENNMQIIDCQAPVCRILPACRLKGIFAKATQAFIDELSNYTLEDLSAEHAAPLRQILQLE